MKDRIVYLLLVVDMVLSLMFYFEFEKLEYFFVSLLFTILFYIGYFIWSNREKKNINSNASHFLLLQVISFLR